jgi:hypothetical protein
MLNLTERDSLGNVQVYSDGFRWSHPADANSIPVTWDETNQFYLAGFSQLGAAGGEIIDGLSLRDSFIIYSERAINILDLSNDVFVWTKRELVTNFSILSKNCVVEANGKHYVLCVNDAIVNDGFNVTPIMHNRVKLHYISHINLAAVSSSFAFLNKRFKEVWFCVPTIGSTEPILLTYTITKMINGQLKIFPQQVKEAAMGHFFQVYLLGTP